MDKWRMIQSARNIDLESMRLANTPFEDLTISIEELEKEAREKGVHDITGFLNSDLFNSTYIFSNRVIRRRNFE